MYDYTIFSGLAMLFCGPAGILSEFTMDSSKQRIDAGSTGLLLSFRKDQKVLHLEMSERPTIN